MEYIFRLAEEKNSTIIMTSHSPVLVDEFKEEPENVFVFDKNDKTKASEIVKLSDFITNLNKEATKKKFPNFPNDVSLGDYWRSGLINGIPK